MNEERNELNSPSGSLNAFQIATAMSELARNPNRKRRIKLEKSIKWLKRNEAFREALKNAKDNHE
tara:strand:+ start:9512 stop:9706 length:195 start_codon:yes stop_codon:yes gene_type:complete